MPKSIKLKNDTYIDASGVTYERGTLKNKFDNELKTYNYTKNYIADSTTRTFKISTGEVFLYINSHIAQRCILLITIWKASNIVRIDTIYKSSDNAVPTITFSGETLSITQPSMSRGYLYELTGQHAV